MDPKAATATRSVRTDLALDLLKQQAENDPTSMEALIQKGEDWKVEAQTITDALETRLWKGRIRFLASPRVKLPLDLPGWCRR